MVLLLLSLFNILYGIYLILFSYNVFQHIHMKKYNFLATLSIQLKYVRTTLANQKLALDLVTKRLEIKRHRLKLLNK